MSTLEAKCILIGFMKNFKPVLNEDVKLVMRGLVTNAPINQNIVRFESLEWF